FEIVDELGRQSEKLARALKIVGLMNVQFAIKGSEIYVLEVNPRASRTVPFVSKALGVQVAKAAARVMTGSTVAELIDEGMLPERDGSDVPADSP
ncbi:MAG: ATP-binding protein, partial [Nostoc sp.]